MGHFPRDIPGRTPLVSGTRSGVVDYFRGTANVGVRRARSTLGGTPRPSGLTPSSAASCAGVGPSMKVHPYRRPTAVRSTAVDQRTKGQHLGTACGAVIPKDRGLTLPWSPLSAPLFYVPGGLVFVDSARVSVGYESQHLATNSRNIRYHTPLYGGV